MLSVAASTAPRYALMAVSLRAHAPNQVIVHGHSCRGAAVLGCAVPRLTASGTALGEEDRRTERGNIRVDLSRPIVIQRLRRTRGGRYFIYRPPLGLLSACLAGRPPRHGRCSRAPHFPRTGGPLEIRARAPSERDRRGEALPRPRPLFTSPTECFRGARRSSLQALAWLQGCRIMFLERTI